MALRYPHAVWMLGLLPIVAVRSLFAAGDMATYTTEFKSDYIPEAVYKSVDSTGKVTYSAGWPEDTVAIELIAIDPAPSAEYVEYSRQRQEKIREAALQLTEAREQREAAREEEEKKRLERLALQRSARPQVYEKKVYVGWNPLWWGYPRAGHYGRYPHKHPSKPAHRPGLSRGLPLNRGNSLK